jgi:flagellar biosynthetic protein FlhB
MADKSDKTEPATAKRRSEARESGHIAKSQDLTSAVLLVAGLLVLSYIAQTFVHALAEILRALLGNQYWGSPQELLDNSLRVSAPQMFKILAPVMLTVAVAALLATGMQVGFHANLSRLAPKLSKLNPFQGFGRLFAGQNWMQFVMNLLKLTIISVIAYNEINSQLPAIMSLAGISFPQNFTIAGGIIYNLAWRIAVALLILALADWIYHKWKFERDIRMSKQEIKDEAKNMEGDQAIKGRRRQLARKMILQRIHRDVPTADVIVTNPTELAIAIKYDQDNMGAPRVVAKGAGFLAQRIRQIAVANGVPIIERKPLAQALYKTVDVGQEVPPEFYQTIAEILAYVYELAGKGLRRRTEQAA